MQKWMKCMVFGCLVLAAAGMLSGCGSNKTVKDTDLGGILQVYTSQPDADINKLVAGFNKKYPEVKVQVFRSGTEEVIARINTEAKAGKLGADVLFLADAPTFEALKAKDLLLAYQSPELQGIRKELVDSDGMYSPTKMIPIGIVVNTNKVKDTAQLDWQSLLLPENRGQLVMPSSLYSGAAAYNAGVFKHTSGLGWDYYEKLKDNQVMVVKGNGDVIKRVASGEKSYGIIVDFMALNAAKQGSPVAFVYPKTGSAVITEPVAIAKTAPNPVAAKAFVDFVLSDEGQKLAAAEGYLPLKSGAASPEVKSALDSLKVLDVSVKQLMEERDADKQAFSALFGG